MLSASVEMISQSLNQDCISFNRFNISRYHIEWLLDFYLQTCMNNLAIG